MNKQLPFPLKPDSAYATYDLSPQEVLQGQILTPLQKAVIQNQLAAFAEDKINLLYNSETVSAESARINYIQREAELMGQINLLRYLLELSISAEQDTLLAREVSQQQ